jgi:hypothetical protein
MEESVRDVSLSIDEKEDRLMRPMKQASSHTTGLIDKRRPGGGPPGKRNGEVIRPPISSRRPRSRLPRLTGESAHPRPPPPK